MATALPVPTKITIDSSKNVTYRVKEATFGDGYKQIAPDGINNKIDTWNIIWGALTDAERNTVETILDTVGSSGIFTWVPCYESVTKKFRMDKEGYTRIREGGTFKITCKLIQCFDL